MNSELPEVEPATPGEVLAIVYVSTATHPFSGHELLELMRQARINNARDHVTGLTLYRRGEFMQVLEGTPAVVATTMSRIARDPRHTNVTIVLRETLAARRFSSWSMGLVHIDELEPVHRQAIGDLLDEPLTSGIFSADPTQAWALLLSFKGSLK